jgi:hypothetical protein
MLSPKLNSVPKLVLEKPALVFNTSELPETLTFAFETVRPLPPLLLETVPHINFNVPYPWAVMPSPQPCPWMLSDFGDADQAVSGWVQNIDLATGRNHAGGLVERAARLHEGAGIAVRCLRGDKDSTGLSLLGWLAATCRRQR